MIDILVPVLGRPQNAQPLADSAANTHNPYRLVFICSPGDHAQLQAAVDTGHETWQVPWYPGRADYARKINWAYPRTHNEWIFTGADDIRFDTCWDIPALLVGVNHPVVGTNDLHNPVVKRGNHATHLLIRRSYIDQHGGTFDNTGIVFSEMYDHQFVDNELVAVARKRKAWGFARRSIVEHHHPNWGNAETDETYDKAMRATRQDHRLHLRRLYQLSRMRDIQK